MKHRHGDLALRTYVLRAWQGDRGYSALGIVRAEGMHVATMSVRGPFQKSAVARAEMLTSLHALCFEMEREQALAEIQSSRPAASTT